MAAKALDLTGETYGRLTITGPAGHTYRHGRRYRLWEALCECGETIVRSTEKIRSGNVRSCGCLLRETASAQAKAIRRPRLNLTGDTFGDLLVVRETEPSVWTCLCVCGRESTASTSALRAGRKIDCGHGAAQRRAEGVARARAERLDLIGAPTRADHPSYAAWVAMKQRCENPNHGYWHRYGGRNITVCERWSGPDGFENFLADVGPRPPNPPGWVSRNPYWSLDRVDPEGDYSPENCKWSTPTEQANNRSSK